MVIGREPDEKFSSRNGEQGERIFFPLYPMNPLSPQDDSGALGRVAPTCLHDSSGRASKLSAEELSSIQRAYIYHKLRVQRIGIQMKSGEGVSSFTSCHSVTFHGIYPWTNQDISCTCICELYHARCHGIGVQIYNYMHFNVHKVYVCDFCQSAIIWESIVCRNLDFNGSV